MTKQHQQEWRRTEAYVTFKREHITRRRTGTDEDRCRRYAATAVSLVAGRLVSIKAQTLPTVVQLKVIFETRHDVTDEQFQQRCIEALNRDKQGS